MEENIEIKRILDILKSKKLLIVLILILFTLVGYVYSYKYTIPEYKSTSTLLLIPNETEEEKVITSADLTLNSELISTYSNIAKKPRVLKQVINNLGLNMTEKELAKNMEVNVVKDTYIIKIAIKNRDANKATEITREVANVFLQEIKAIYNLNNIGIVDEAQVPTMPYNINHKKDIIMFGAIGLGVSFVCIIAIYVFDNTIKTEEDIERYIKVKPLGKIPLNTDRKQEIVNRNNAKSYITECINTIRTNILYMTSIKSSKTILVTSCTSQEGKSWFSANIASSFAETNKRVLLIDADMRKGRANKIFGVSSKDGLSDYLYSMTGDIKSDLQLAKNYIKETRNTKFTYIN